MHEILIVVFFITVLAKMAATLLVSKAEDNYFYSLLEKRPYDKYVLYTSWKSKNGFG